jgi:hypothetical protein
VPTTETPRWPGGMPPGSVSTKLNGDFYDVNYTYHSPGFPTFTVTLMVHKDAFPPGWRSVAWVDKVGPEFIEHHFASSWNNITASVKSGKRRVLLMSRVNPGEDVTK